MLPPTKPIPVDGVVAGVTVTEKVKKMQSVEWATVTETTILLLLHFESYHYCCSSLVDNN